MSASLPTKASRDLRKSSCADRMSSLGRPSACAVAVCSEIFFNLSLAASQAPMRMAVRARFLPAPSRPTSSLRYRLSPSSSGSSLAKTLTLRTCKCPKISMIFFGTSCSSKRNLSSSLTAANPCTFSSSLSSTSGIA